MKSILDSIVTSINDSISAEFSASPFTGKQIFGVTEKSFHKEIIAPSIISDGGKITPIFCDKMVPLLIYHKQYGVNYDYNLPESFGKGFLHRATHKMSMVIFTMKSRTKIDGKEMAQIIEKSFPTSWDKTFKKNLALRSLNTRLESCDSDADAIYKREWVGTKDPTVIPESSLLEVRYQIVRTFKGDCAVNCCN